MSDKVRPNIDHLHKLLKLLNDGYAFVGLYRFAFFGFKKELFRQIGPMDEGYIGGEYEDDDFYLRLKEANLAMYLSHEVPYIHAPSGWNNSVSRKYFLQKWGNQILPYYKKAIRQFPENLHQYNFGISTGDKFLSWQYTQIIPTKVHKYLHIKIV
jgi:GT2 family glycosyltransferase